MLLVGIAFWSYPFKSAYASKVLDGAIGLDESFDTGYTARAMAEDSHYQQAYAQYLTQKKGKDEWVITKSFSSSITYDDNISATRRLAKDDVIHSHTPSIAIARQMKKVFITAFYTVSATRHVENPESNTVNHSLGQEIRYQGNRITAAFTNSLQPGSSYAVGERTELSVDGKSKVTTYADNASLNVSYRISPKTSVALNSGYKLLYFPIAQTSAEVNGFSEYDMNTGPSISYQILPKTSVTASYNFNRAYFFQGGGLSSRTDGVTFGVGTKLSQKMGASASIGYSMLSYDKNVLGYDSLNLNFALTRKLTEKIYASLGYSSGTSANYDSLTGQNLTQDQQNYLLNLSWRLSSHMSLTGGASMVINSKEGFITLPDPDNPTLTFTREQEDISYEWDALWSWNPEPYVGFTLGYRFLNKNSSFVDFEYDEQRVTAQASCKF